MRLKLAFTGKCLRFRESKIKAKTKQPLTSEEYIMYQRKLKTIVKRKFSASVSFAVHIFPLLFIIDFI